MEFCSVKCAGMAAVEPGGGFSGYGSVFNAVDDGGDLILPGAFTESLTKRTPKLLYNHDFAEPVGLIQTAIEDAYGLKITAEISAQATRGAHCLSLMRMGALDGLSIGYVVTETQPTNGTGATRVISKIELYEISIVVMPMQPLAITDRPKKLVDFSPEQGLRAELTRELARILAVGEQS